MIIKSFEIPTRYTHSRFRNHVFRGDENERITLVHGVEADVEDFFEYARREDSRVAVIHFIIAPGEQSTSIDEFWEVARDLASEFNFDLSSVVIVEHQKPRVGNLGCGAGNGCDRHWHILVQAQAHDERGAIDLSHSYPRQEAVARLAEWKLGHPFVNGAHTGAVIRALKRNGWRQAAIALSDAFAGQAASERTAFTHAEAQAAKRNGHNLSEVRAIVRSAWREAASAGEFKRLVAERGLVIAAGDGDPPAWVVKTADGIVLMRVTKAAHVTRADVKERLGEPHEGNEIGQPGDETSRRFGCVAHDPEGKPGAALRDRCVSIESVSGDRGRSAEQEFTRRLTEQKDRIETFAVQAERAALPVAIRLNEQLIRLENVANAIIARAEGYKDDSPVLVACREDLRKAREESEKALKAHNAARQSFADLLQAPRPPVWRGASHRKSVHQAEQRVAKAEEALMQARAQVSGALNRVKEWEGIYEGQSKRNRQALVPKTSEARRTLKIIEETRALARRCPTFLRFGQLAAWQLATKNIDEGCTGRIWSGAVDIWGVPIEPPKPPPRFP